MSAQHMPGPWHDRRRERTQKSKRARSSTPSAKPLPAWRDKIKNDIPNYGFMHFVFAVGVLLFVWLMISIIGGHPAKAAAADCAANAYEMFNAVPRDDKAALHAVTKCKPGTLIMIPDYFRTYVAFLCDGARPIIHDRPAVVCTLRKPGPND